MKTKKWTPITRQRVPDEAPDLAPGEVGAANQATDRFERDPKTPSPTVPTADTNVTATPPTSSCDFQTAIAAIPDGNYFLPVVDVNHMSGTPIELRKRGAAVHVRLSNGFASYPARDGGGRVESDGHGNTSWVLVRPDGSIDLPLVSTALQARCSTRRRPRTHHVGRACIKDGVLELDVSSKYQTGFTYFATARARMDLAWIGKPLENLGRVNYVRGTARKQTPAKLVMGPDGQPEGVMLTAVGDVVIPFKRLEPPNDDILRGVMHDSAGRRVTVTYQFINGRGRVV